MRRHLQSVEKEMALRMSLEHGVNDTECRIYRNSPQDDGESLTATEVSLVPQKQLFTATCKNLGTPRNFSSCANVYINNRFWYPNMLKVLFR
ncbi:hypothetical protein BYT27DRAFT_6338170 [Phlegmacium glaucopus]|nr:hypothetical protein BYT27DRAFT_6338170 [Phlegmacium glaucopus]